jgi:hypothetical protein
MCTVTECYFGNTTNEDETGKAYRGEIINKCKIMVVKHQSKSFREE